MSYLVHFDFRAHLSTKDLFAHFASTWRRRVVHINGFFKADGRREGGGEGVKFLLCPIPHAHRIVASEDKDVFLEEGR